MPSSLSAKPAERSRAVWEGENTDLSSSIPQCRFSISTAGEISYRPDVLPRPSSSLSEPPAEVQQHELAPSTPRFSITPSLSSSRVERLVRERQLRKSGSCYTLVDEFEGKVEASMGSIGGGGACERGLLLGQGAAGGAAEHSQENVGTAGANVKGQQLRAIQRLLVVANRLPVSAQRDGDTWDLKLSAGGLVSALLGVKQNFETRWIGWAGVHVHDEKGRISLRDSLASKGCVPVFLDDDTVDQYYNGYCNNVLWPLFHYIGLSQEDRLAGTQSLDSQYIAYKHANQLFADVVFSQYQVQRCMHHIYPTLDLAKITSSSVFLLQ